MLAAGIQYYTEEYIVNTFARYSNTQGQDTVEALVQRRFEEALIFVSGDYGTGGTPLYEFEYRELEDGEYELYHRVWGQYSPGLYSDVPYTQWYYRYVSPLSACLLYTSRRPVCPRRFFAAISKSRPEIGPTFRSIYSKLFLVLLVSLYYNVYPPPC